MGFIKRNSIPIELSWTIDSGKTGVLLQRIHPRKPEVEVVFELRGLRHVHVELRQCPKVEDCRSENIIHEDAWHKEPLRLRIQHRGQVRARERIVFSVCIEIDKKTLEGRDRIGRGLKLQTQAIPAQTRARGEVGG